MSLFLPVLYLQSKAHTLDFTPLEKATHSHFLEILTKFPKRFHVSVELNFVCFCTLLSTFLNLLVKSKVTRHDLPGPVVSAPFTPWDLFMIHWDLLP